MINKGKLVKEDLFRQVGVYYINFDTKSTLSFLKSDITDYTID